MNRTNLQRLRAPVPCDPGLPGLALVLDPAAAAELAVERLVGPDARVTGVRPVYVRYKPGTNCIAAYEIELAGADGPAVMHAHLKCHAPDEAPVHLAKIAEGDWRPRAGGAGAAVVPEHQTAIMAFPNDPVLDGLALAARPKKLQRLLYAHVDVLPEDEWRISDRRIVVTPVRIKPEKRAVYRLDTRAVHRETGVRRSLRLYVRVQADGRGAATSRLSERIRAEFTRKGGDPRTPRVLAHLPEHGMTLVMDAGGAPFGIDGASCATAGHVLAALHAVPVGDLELRGFAAALRAAGDTVESLAALDPALGERAERLLERLTSRAAALGPAPVVLTHGDYHPGQLLAHEDGTVLLDYDRAHAGDGAADLGNYTAHLVEGLGRERALAPNGPAAAVTAAYAASRGEAPDPSRIAAWTALGLLMRAPAPFRRLDSDWPSACRRLLDAGLEVSA